MPSVWCKGKFPLSNQHLWTILAVYKILLVTKLEVAEQAIPYYRGGCIEFSVVLPFMLWKKANVHLGWNNQVKTSTFSNMRKLLPRGRDINWDKIGYVDKDRKSRILHDIQETLDGHWSWRAGVDLICTYAAIYWSFLTASPQPLIWWVRPWQDCKAEVFPRLILLYDGSEEQESSDLCMNEELGEPPSMHVEMF